MAQLQVASATLFPDGAPPSEPPEEIIMAGRQSTSARTRNAAPLVWDKAGTVSAAALPVREYNAYNVPLRIRKVVLSAGTAPTGASLIVDVKINGTSVFTASNKRASIAANAQYGEAVPDKTDLDAITVKPGQYVTVEVTQVGSTVAGSDLRVKVLLG